MLSSVGHRLPSSGVAVESPSLSWVLCHPHSVSRVVGVPSRCLEPKVVCAYVCLPSSVSWLSSPVVVLGASC